MSSPLPPKGADLQSAAFADSLPTHMVPQTGIEPAHTGLQPAALPTELPRHVVVAIRKVSIGKSSKHCLRLLLLVSCGEPGMDSNHRTPKRSVLRLPELMADPAGTLL